MTDSEREEWQALVDADTLMMLPKEALVASVKSLAKRLLELTSEQYPNPLQMFGDLDKLIQERKGHNE